MANTPDQLQTILPLIQRFLGTDPDALTRTQEQIRAEIEQYERALAQSRAQLAAIERLVEGAKTAAPPINGVPAARRTINAPPMRSAIRVVLRDNGAGLTNDEILAELFRRGWAPGGKTPKNTVNSRLSDLMHDHDVIKEDGRYRLTRGGEEGLPQTLA